MALTVKNPYGGKAIGQLEFASPEAVSQALQRAQAAFESWRKSTAWARAQLLEEVAAEIEAKRNDFAELMREEAGKPIDFAHAEVTRALGVLRWSAAEAQRFSGELLRLDAASGGRQGFGISARFPRGVVLGITPFNFPLNLVLHKVAPAVAAGCAILIKPSPATPLTALKLCELFQKRVPDVVQVVIADDEATVRLTQAPEIAMVSFTGSAKVGKLIRRQAHDKPVTLELGGNAWVIVLDDTPESLFPAIARRIASAAYGYAGQSCISVQNAAIAASAWPKLRDALAQATERVPYGDPSRKGVVSGPVINEASAKRISSELLKAPSGAELVCSQALQGDESPSVIKPTLVTLEQDSDSSLVQEEIFGPVMSARGFDSLDALIRKINTSRYGLQAGVFTQNLSAIETLFRELEVGGLIVNDVPTTRYDHQPYGGVKDSGQGREGIRYAMEEMTQPKFLALSSQVG